MRDYPFPWRWDATRYTEAYRNSGILESSVQASALAILRAQGCLAWVVDAGAKQLRGRAVAEIRANGGNVAALVGRTGAGVKGMSDIMGIYRPGNRGQAIFIECKAPGKNPTQEQLDFLYAVRQAGAIAGVAWAGLDVIPILAQGDYDDE